MFVASTQPVFVTSRSSENTSLLDGNLLDDRLEHEIAVAEALVHRRAGRDRREEARLVLVSVRPRAAALSISDRIDARAPSTISWSRSRKTTGTSSRRTNSAPSCAAIRPAPTMPTFRTGRGSAAELGPAALRAARRGRTRRSRPAPVGRQELRDRLLLSLVAPPRRSRWPRLRSGRARGTARESRRGRRRRRRSGLGA